MRAYIFQTSEQSLFPTLPAFSVPQWDSLPIVSNLSHGSCKLFGRDTKDCVFLAGVVVFDINIFLEVHKRKNSTMTNERNGAQVIYEGRMDLGKQLTGRIKHRVPNGLFEFVQRESR